MPVTFPNCPVVSRCLLEKGAKPKLRVAIDLGIFGNDASCFALSRFLSIQLRLLYEEDFHQLVQPFPTVADYSLLGSYD